MSPTFSFLEQMLRQGEAVMHDRPLFSDEEKPEIVRLLESVYEQRRLEAAGPLLPFDAEAGYAAARFVSQACWALVSNEESLESVQKSLQLPLNPASAEAHLSADLTLRLLVSVHRRLRIRPPGDPLLQAVVDVLRRWPLSGVLADVAEAPLSDLQFHGHPGLQLLYAERLVGHVRAAWIPAGGRVGRTREVVELVFQQRGQSLPAPVEEKPA